MWKNNGRGDRIWQRTTGVSGWDGEGFRVAGMDERGGLGDRLSNGSGDMVAFTVASTRASSLWEGDVEGSVARGGARNVSCGGGTGSGGVKD